MKPNIQSYPSYSTSKIKNSFINPYAEFSNFCVYTYYRIGNINLYTLSEFNKFDKSKKIDVLNTSLSANDINSEIEFIDDNVIEIKMNRKYICTIKIENIIGMYDDVIYTSMYLDFNKNDDFSYIIDNNSNIYSFYELPNNNEQLDLLISLIVGLCKFGSFMKYHKLMNIKLKNIDTFIRSLNPYTNNELEVVYDCNGFRIYIDVDNVIHYYESDYSSYMNNIDDYFSKLK